jgi:hypothetical protein
MQATLGLSLAVMGTIAGISYLGFLLAVMLTVWAAPRIGARPLVILGGLAGAGGMALIATAQGAWALGAGVFLAGTSPGFAYTPLSDVIMHQRALLCSAKRSMPGSMREPGLVSSSPGRWRSGRARIGVWPGLCLPRLPFLATLWIGAALRACGPGHSPPRQGGGRPHRRWIGRAHAAARVRSGCSFRPACSGL